MSLPDEPLNPVFHKDDIPPEAVDPEKLPRSPGLQEQSAMATAESRSPGPAGPEELSPGLPGPELRGPVPGLDEELSPGPTGPMPRAPEPAEYRTPQ